MPPQTIEVYAEPKDGDTPETQDFATTESGERCVYLGTLWTNREAVADLMPLLLGAVQDGRRVNRVEVCKPGKGPVLDRIHSLTVTTTRCNVPESRS